MRAFDVLKTEGTVEMREFAARVLGTAQKRIENFSKKRLRSFEFSGILEENMALFVSCGDSFQYELY